MKVFVAGATGVLGARLVPLLVRAGHEVHGVARDDTKATWLADQGAKAVTVDLFDPDSVQRLLADIRPDAVVHVATSIPKMTKAGRKSAWAMNGRLRAEVTPILVAAAVAAGARVFVKDSVAFYYEDHADAPIHEDSPVLNGPVMAPTYAGERATLAFTSGGQRRGVVLRFGYFYGAHTTGTEEALRLARFGLSPMVGSRQEHWPMLHLDDAASAVRAALEHDVAGIFNVADDSIPKGDNLEAFAAAFSKRRAPRVTPTWMMRAVAPFAVPVLSGSKRVASDRFRTATGWAPKYPTPAQGWPAIAAESTP